jgi:hypothetical protein
MSGKLSTTLAKWRLIARYSLRTAAHAIIAVLLILLAPIGFREVLMFGGAILLGQGVAAYFPPAALIVPGAVFVYVALFGVA